MFSLLTLGIRIPLSFDRISKIAESSGELVPMPTFSWACKVIERNSIAIMKKRLVFMIVII